MRGEGAQGRAERFQRTWFRYLPVCALTAGVLFIPLFLQAETTVQRVITGAVVGGNFLTAAIAWFARREFSGEPAERARSVDGLL